MGVDPIVYAYKLNDIEITPDSLLLDPKNPRIALNIQKSEDYTLHQLKSADIQEYITNVIYKPEFHVADLIELIGQNGFLDLGTRIIVERVKGTDKYLILEGNRRVSAIKHLLKNSSSLSPHVIESLRKIKASELIINDKSSYSRDEVVSKILGILHLNGQLDWGAMERAYYIYNRYTQELDKIDTTDELFYDETCSAECGRTFHLEPLEVREELAIYSVYSQLRNEEYRVKEKHYTLIQMAVHTRRMNWEYFGLDWDYLNFSPEGLERFNKLCLEGNCPVHNPGDFKKVVQVFKNARDMLPYLESGASALLDIMETINNVKVKFKFLDELEKVYKKLSTLKLSAPSGTKLEKLMAEKIRDTAEEIIRVL